MIYEDEERPGQAVDEMVARWEEQDRKRDDPRAEAAAEPADKPLIKTSAEFVADFTPPTMCSTASYSGGSATHSPARPAPARPPSY
jgi:hypothetical protein